MKYKLIKDFITGEIMEGKVQRLADNAFIPFDPANTDAQAFARWLQEGNRPEPAQDGDVITDEWVQETITNLLG